MPTPARRAISSRLTFSPTSAKAALAASISACRFRALSARGLRAGAVGFLFTLIDSPKTGLAKRRIPPYIVLSGGSLHFHYTMFIRCRVERRAKQRGFDHDPTIWSHIDDR